MRANGLHRDRRRRRRRPPLSACRRAIGEWNRIDKSQYYTDQMTREPVADNHFFDSNTEFWFIYKTSTFALREVVIVSRE